MKNGGWLNKYDDGGVQPNYNDASVSMSDDFVGLGYNTKGRDYSPAWGGQFQDGGYIDSVLNANKKLDWVQRLYEENTPSIKIKGQKGKATHFMESSDGRAYPTVVRMADGKLKYLGDDAYDYADKTKTYIQFPSDREAQLFSENYKKGTNVLKDFQRGGKLTPVSPMQQVEQVVQPTPTVPYLQTKDPAEFYKSWIQSPEYERRLKSTGYSDVPNKQRVDELSQIEQVKKERLGLLENIQPLEYDPSKRSEAIIDYYDGSTINVNPSDYKTFSKQSVEAHEIAHVATPTSTMSNDEFGIFMGSMLPLKKPIVSGVQGSKEREASKEAVGDFEHLGKPWEAKADLDALRFMMYDKGIYDITKGKKFTESDFEKAKQSFGKERVFKRFTDRMGKKNFVNLMNTIAKADGEEELPMAMGGMSIPGSVGFSYARTAGSAPSEGKYAKKTMASAQNGQEMKFYQNGLDWKPKSMQYGGEEEMYEGQQLPEFTVTPYDEQYPFYQTLSPEQKKYINDEGPIGRGIRAIATTGKVGQTAKDISTPYRTVQEVASEVTGIPGTIRFSNDPVKNLKGAGKTLLDLGVSGASAFSPTGYGSLGGYNPITKEELFNQQNLEGTFNTLDTFGLVSGMVAPIAKPIGIAVGKAAVPHLTSISNIANETLDAVQAINNAKKLEKLSMVDVPALPGIDKLKDVRNFGKELAELESKSKNATLSDLKSLREKYTKLSEQAKEFKSSGIFKADDANKQSSLQTDYDIGLRLIDNKLNKLSNFKLDDFINNLKKQGANKVALETLRNNPDLALRYSDTVSSFSDSRMAEELITGDTLSALENFRAYPNSGKTTNFSPNKRGINSDRIDPITGDSQWSGSTELKKIDNKLYEDGWGSDKFYSYPFYKNVGDKIVDAYSNLRLSGSPVISPLQQYSEAIELMPSLFADRYNVGSMLRQASRYIDETPDGLMFPAGSLSGDSYPLALNMMARELKNNPDSKLRLIGFGRSNELGFADKVKNPKLLQSELSQIIKGIEDVSGQRLPKPYVFGNNTDQIMLPKFAISKGSTNKVIQDYLNNTSIADRLGVKRPVREVSPNPATPISNPPQTIDFDPTDVDYNFKNGGVIKDNQGYWNPENWGKPVEIDSNDITMEPSPYTGVEVPYNVLGVSDTGDTKLMKPGKNYKFKGKKVREYPVGKLGINQLDAQPMKKLNQLLNFTNNPDKDNWLDKYN
jgi:hypothetical protein